VRRYRILGGPLRGLSLVTSWYDYPAALLGRTERLLLNWFQANVRAGETWLDVGAHYGYTSLALSKLVGTDGRVYAFEPMIASAGCILRTRESNGFHNLTVIPSALGSSEDVIVMHLPRTRGMIDSTIEADGLDEPFLVAGFDWLWPRICGTDQRLHGVKIDVQGMENEVLRGMRQMLRQHRPKLAIELHKGVSREFFLEVLAECGYTSPGIPIESLLGESAPQYADDRSYAFVPDQPVV
jgi:FkbM family methyltransferase